MKLAAGTYPEPHHIIVEATRGEASVECPYYVVRYDTRRGAITGIQLRHVGPENLLLGPCSADIGLVGSEKAFAPAGPARMEIVETDPLAPQLSFDAPLKDADGLDSGVRLKTLYRHGWGYIHVRQEWSFPRGGVRAMWLKPHTWTLDPSLTHFGVRPGAPAETSPHPNSMACCEWGRFQPGASLNAMYASRHVPRYAGFGAPGRYGIEWFAGSRLDQWDYQLTGSAGHGSLCISAQASPPGIVFVVCALDTPRGGVRLTGRCVFDFFIGIPIITGAAHPPFLHASFNRKHWPSNAVVDTWARRGIRTAHFHHDGDYFKDSKFWRDGIYPPFDRADMKEFDRVISACHRRGIRVATYFSNKELHPDVPASRKHGRDWARLPDDRGKQVFNRFGGDFFGAQMCLRSGWRDFFKEYVDKVLSHHNLDGTYYDWNLGLYCHNRKHAGMHGAFPPGIGAQANSPTGHWDMEELLEVMEWTRHRVGSGGLVIVHNSATPMAATENFADHVVAMEFGYSRLSTGVPEPDDLPFEWNFMGARPRGVIGYGCLDPQAPVPVRKQFHLRCLLAGVAPWSADKASCRLFQPLREIAQGGFNFHDWNSGFVRTDDPQTAAIAYSSPDRILVAAANLTSSSRTIRCRICANSLTGYIAREWRVRVGNRTSKLSSNHLVGKGLKLDMPGDGALFVWLTPVL